VTEHDWRLGGPPPEAYSRVTDAGRFHPLHALALELVERLGDGYDASRSATFDALPGMTPFEHARPPVRLVPRVPAAAPIAVAFTAFPSVLVRCGRWLVESFPSCGCDACAETAEGEGERLVRLLDDVVAGRFHETIAVPLLGRATLRWTLGAAGPAPGVQSSAWRVLPRAMARALAAGGPRDVRWQPWPLRARVAPRGAPPL
jgi:hypothetical protein